jgi:hypothetical protein
MTPVPVANLFLLILALFALIVWVVPEAQSCWIPPNAPTRGMYSDCWEASILWA